MGGASDLSEDVVLAAGAAAPVGGKLAAQHALSIHKAMARHIRSVTSGVSTSGRTVLELDDPPALVASWLRERAGRELGNAPTWIRLARRDLQRGAVLVISDPHSCGEADLTVIADPGMLTRGMLIDATKWAFFALRLTRIVVRIPAVRADLQDYARRAGFRHEGTAYGFFQGEGDASVWSMTARSCRWLSPRSPVPAPANAAPLPSFKVH